MQRLRMEALTHPLSSCLFRHAVEGTRNFSNHSDVNGASALSLAPNQKGTALAVPFRDSALNHFR
jgi:hypothetical protein